MNYILYCKEVKDTVTQFIWNWRFHGLWNQKYHEVFFYKDPIDKGWVLYIVIKIQLWEKQNSYLFIKMNRKKQYTEYHNEDTLGLVVSLICFFLCLMRKSCNIMYGCLLSHKVLYMHKLHDKHLKKKMIIICMLQYISKYLGLSEFVNPWFAAVNILA